MANENSRQDDNQFPALVGHSGTAGTAETKRIVAESGAVWVREQGTANVGTINSVIPGTAATELGKAEDNLHASGDTGVAVWGVKKNSNVSLAGDGDYHPFEINADGRLYTEAFAIGDKTHAEADGVYGPVKIGGKAFNTPPTAVSTAQRVNAWYDFNGRAAVFQMYSYFNTGTAGTTVLKNTSGVLHTLTINSKSVGGTGTIFDNGSAASGTVIAVIDTTLSTTAFLYDIYFINGLTFAWAGNAGGDVTISYK